MKKLIVGNWKLNGNADKVALWGEFDPSEVSETVEFVICPPAVYFTDLAIHLDDQIAMGAQDCSIRSDEGAFTGEISASMLADIGCDYVIVGHSERRQHNNDTNQIINKKAENAVNADLIAIICVGETLAEREAGSAQSVVKTQILESIPSNADFENIVIAYEPVWAIGTGKVAEPDDIQKMHGVIREILKEKLDNGDAIRILYGGSVKASNAQSILSLVDVDGALVGGASLSQTEFMGIAKAG